MNSNLTKTRNTIPEKSRVHIAAILQERLADSLNLYLQLKQAHWNVKGRSFISIHTLLDKVASESEEYSDLIAERIVQLGDSAEGTLEAVSRSTKLPKYPLTVTLERDHIANLAQALSIYGELTRVSINQLESFNDPATIDILTEILRGTEKNLWLIEAHSQGASSGAGVSESMNHLPRSREELSPRFSASKA
jgi:starvation-inducible DNA-binding protein